MLCLKIKQLIRALLVIRSGTGEYEKRLKKWLEQFQDEADKEAQAIIDAKIKRIWRSTSPTKMLDIKVLQRDSLELVSQIAKVYYPSSERPELEVTLLELLSLNQRISEEIRTLVEPFPLMHSISIASIIETRDIFEKTQDTLTTKGLKTGGKIANRVWMVWNAMRPTYWINKAIFKGAGEVVSRKILSTIFRIVGAEALRVYKSSSKTRIDPSLLDVDLKEFEDELMDEEKLKSKHTVETELIEPLLEYTPKQRESNHQEPKPAQEAQIDESESETESVDKKMDEVQTTSTKQKLYKAVTNTFNQFLGGSLHMWDKLVSRESVYKAFTKRGCPVNSLEEIRDLPIEAADEVADHYISMGEWYTAAEGAATGFGGFLLLSADAVSLLALQLRTIQQIGYCYGFDVTRPEEKLFAAKLLAEAYTHPKQGHRKEVINTMREAASIIKESKPLALIRQRLFVTGISKVAEKVGIKLGGRASAKLVPVLGAVAGGYINKKVTKEIADVAKDVYRKRLEDRKKAEEHS